MTLTILLFDIGPVGGGVGAILGIAFFFIFAAIAYITFRLLKKTVKMAVRMAIVAAILIIALIGSIAFLWFGSSGRGPVRPTPRSTR